MKLFVVAGEPSGEAEHPVVVGLVEIPDDAGALARVDDGVGLQVMRGRSFKNPAAGLGSGSLLVHGPPI